MAEKKVWQQMIDNVDPEKKAETLEEYKAAYEFLKDSAPKAELTANFKKAIASLEKDN